MLIIKTKALPFFYDKAFWFAFLLPKLRLFLAAEEASERAEYVGSAVAVLVGHGR
jgi:hypothetical protein